ncbi:MAG TPA: hypothetical protein VJV23_08580 [Candidatus Polarisedimenticolia bacterium]|nr:hypothetical protein [Candidatus Polarisedimenticolia bacterium]
MAAAALLAAGVLALASTDRAPVAVITMIRPGHTVEIVDPERRRRPAALLSGLAAGDTIEVPEGAGLTISYLYRARTVQLEAGDSPYRVVGEEARRLPERVSAAVLRAFRFLEHGRPLTRLSTRGPCAVFLGPASQATRASRAVLEWTGGGPVTLILSANGTTLGTWGPLDRRRFDGASGSGPMRRGMDHRWTIASQGCEDSVTIRRLTSRESRVVHRDLARLRSIAASALSRSLLAASYLLDAGLHAEALDELLAARPRMQAEAGLHELLGRAYLEGRDCPRANEAFSRAGLKTVACGAAGTAEREEPPGVRRSLSAGEPPPPR